jgi:ferredoxin--NADP+ reductase
LVDGRSQFACVDGPEFDGHLVDFAVLTQRNSTYREEEDRSMEEFRHHLDPRNASPDDAGCAHGGRR